MTLVLRYMRLADIPQVVNIDRQAFSTPWSARSYSYEVGESNYSYMLVLEDSPNAPDAIDTPLSGFRRWLRDFSHSLSAGLSRSGNGISAATRGEVLGYGGLWNIMDEAHISTIATSPEQRGKGYGELLLAAMILRSLSLNAGYIVLEVRVSNTVAQNLYRKYGFKVEDVKRNYYRDDGEDAYDMRLDLLDTAIVTQARELAFAALARHTATDQYTEFKRPTSSRE